MIDTIKNQIEQLDDPDFQGIRNWVLLDEVKRREALPAREDAKVGLIKGLADQGEITRPEVATEEAAINGDGVVPAWVDPAGKDHRAYMAGEAVLDDGKIYINRKSGLNLKRPNSPDSGWELHNPPKEDAPQPEPEAEAPTDDQADDQAEDQAEDPAHEETPGAPAWREPQSKTDLYAKGAEVTHQGAQWRSTTDSNRTEPGTDDSWEKIEG
ncbi:hypothetical protein QP933_06745 [Corynebacterium pseudodiphtheriticum]|uniref:hypothetical protein n=1 Tax=Corynebacterium pseudodiphtheriticum TaxID=37637 RepID=UPI00254AD17E|nr:hypothetical protein [Corynebacterium pseudodiphtheriticum]MDK8500636.1 hypothetical protein [Corynebacterium pseudodiphtheriticum]MDK8775805.1 hypothetical protein [Corynebacterium pseudodiphtheriticum]